MTAMIKQFKSLLEIKSTPWDDTFAYYSLTQGSYLKNPVEDLKLLVLNEGLDVDDFNYYMCNWTQYSITTKSIGTFNHVDTLRNVLGILFTIERLQPYDRQLA